MCGWLCSRLMPVSPSDPPVCPTWRCTGEETTHFSRAQIQPAPPQGLRCARAQGGSVSTESHWLLGGFGQWSHSVETRGREKRRIRGLFSSSLCCLGQRLAASLLRLQLPPCSPRLGDPGSSCPARPPPGGPDRSMVTPTPLFTPAPPPRGGSIFLPGLI